MAKLAQEDSPVLWPGTDSAACPAMLGAPRTSVTAAYGPQQELPPPAPPVLTGVDTHLAALTLASGSESRTGLSGAEATVLAPRRAGNPLGAPRGGVGSAS